MSNVRSLVFPRSLAVVGASPRNPAAFGNTVMGSYAYLGQENLAALGEFLAASKGTGSSSP